MKAIADRLGMYVTGSRDRFVRFVLLDTVFTLGVGAVIGYAVRSYLM